MSKVNYEQAAQMYRDGKSHYEIAEVFGVSRQAICSGFLNKGIVTRRSQKVRLCPDPMNLAYIAGVFDGEGHVSIALSKSKQKEQFWLQVGIVNTDKGLLDYIHQSFGIGRINQTTSSGKMVVCNAGLGDVPLLTHLIHFECFYRIFGSKGLLQK